MSVNLQRRRPKALALPLAQELNPLMLHRFKSSLNHVAAMFLPIYVTALLAVQRLLPEIYLHAHHLPHPPMVPVADTCLHISETDAAIRERVLDHLDLLGMTSHPGSPQLVVAMCLQVCGTVN